MVSAGKGKHGFTQPLLTGRGPLGGAGFTLTELLTVIVLLGLVFFGATSLYLTALRMLKARQSVDVTALPNVALEQMVKKVVVANNSPPTSLTQAGSQLNLRIDYDLCSDTRAVPTPSNFADDNWWHYRFTGGQLLFLCNNAAGTNLTAAGNPAGTVALLSGLNTATTLISITNPSASGTATVANIHLVSTTPAMTIDTEAAFGATTKR